MDVLLTNLLLHLFRNNGSLLLTVVGLAGLFLCYRHHAKMPIVSKRVSLASVLLLLRSLAIPLVVFFVPITLQPKAFDEIYKLIYLALEAVAFWLLLSVAFRDA